MLDDLEPGEEEEERQAEVREEPDVGIDLGDVQYFRADDDSEDDLHDDCR